MCVWCAQRGLPGGSETMGASRPLPHRLECISFSLKSSRRILIIFYFISVFSFTPPLLSSRSLFPSDFILPPPPPFTSLLHSVLESDCLLCEIVVHSLLTLSVSLLQQSRLQLSNSTPLPVFAIYCIFFALFH